MTQICFVLLLLLLIEVQMERDGRCITVKRFIC
jgi:hypothetical protein